VENSAFLIKAGPEQGTSRMWWLMTKVCNYNHAFHVRRSSKGNLPINITLDTPWGSKHVEISFKCVGITFNVEIMFEPCKKRRKSSRHHESVVLDWFPFEVTTSMSSSSSSSSSRSLDASQILRVWSCEPVNIFLLWICKKIARSFVSVFPLLT
jgi:hypothetical protein